MSKDPTIGMFVGDEEIERRQRRRLATPLPDPPVAGETLEEIVRRFVADLPPTIDCAFNVAKKGQPRFATFLQCSIIEFTAHGKLIVQNLLLGFRWVDSVAKSLDQGGPILSLGE